MRTYLLVIAILALLFVALPLSSMIESGKTRAYVQSSATPSAETAVPAQIASPQTSQSGFQANKPAIVQAMSLLSDSSGWVLTERRLLFSTSFGKEWRDITPSAGNGKLLGASFIDSTRGWVAIRSRNAITRQNQLAIATTLNGGDSWSLHSLLSESEYEKYEPGDSVDLQFVDSVHGWILIKLTSGSNFSRGLLLKTSDGGNSWRELSNAPAAGRIRFVNDQDGWLAGGPQADRLFFTRNGGTSWTRVEIQSPLDDASLSPAFDLPTFQNRTEGILPVTFTGATKTFVAFYETKDAGSSWSFSNLLPGSEPLAAGSIVPSAVLPNSTLTAATNELRLTVLKNGKTQQRTPIVSTINSGRGIADLSFENESAGWLLVLDGRCEGFKTQCSQTSKLFATSDGGTTLVEITPSAAQDTGTPDDALETQSVITSRNRKGFDKCAAGTASQMQTWWTDSPYFDSNIYIGGVNRGCTQANLTASWVTQVFGQGWGLIPTWVGPQATCTTCSTCSVMSSDPTTARSQGISEANSAANAASALGLGTTIIYYDMERYNPTTSCQSAVRSFINGWVEQMHSRGNLAGVYGSPQNAQEDWTVISHPPDAVWIAKWDNVISVFGLTPLSDSFWVNSQRIHQYQGGHNETWGGITFNIDNDFEDAPVAGNGTTPPPSSVNLTPFQPSGWSDKIVVSTGTGTSTDSTTLRTTDTLFIDWAVVNNGTSNITTNFNEKLFVDGVERQTFTTNAPLNANTFTFFQDFSIGTLTAGTHTIRIVADSGGVITETNEGDNEYTKTITVTSGQPNLTPFQPSGWSDKIVVSNVTGTTTDTSLKTTDTVFVDWAAINNGTAPTSSTFHTRLLVDGVERSSWFTNPPMNANSFAFVSDFSLGALSAGSHTLRIIVDYTSSVAESNESDNEYTRTINVAAPPSCFSLTTSVSPGGGGSISNSPGFNCSSSFLPASAPEVETSEPMATQVLSDSGPGRVPDTDETFTRLISKADAGEPVRVILGLNTAFLPEGFLPNVQQIQTQRNNISTAQSNVLQQLSAFNVRAITKFTFIPFMAMELDASGLRYLQSSPEITSIEEDLPRPVSLAESVPLIGGNVAWSSGFSGAGQTVAILDSGVDKTHPFLSGKVVSEACYSTTNSSFTSVCPGGVQESTSVGSGVNCSVSLNADCKHGTHVAGIAAGKGSSFSGVAKDATIIAIQVFSQPVGGGRLGALDSNMISGLQRVQQLNGSFKIAAVNMSIGGGINPTSCDSANPSMKAAIDNLRSIGIATVISSGNDSSSTGISYPACISSAISTGSTDDGSLGTTTNQVSDFSNSASIVKLLAPGRWINSSVPDGGFSNFFGTSMAAPHVTGTWAVLKSKAESATVDQVLQALTSTGLPVTDSRNGITKPRIKVDAALNALGGGGGVSGYSSGTVVTLTAVANSGFVFQSWTGCDSASGANCSVTMNSNRSVSATFQPVSRSLTIASSSPGSGVSITVSPNDNGSLGSGTTTFTRTYNNNTVVNLTAPATAGGNNFQKWQRNSVDWSSSQSTSVTMDASYTMTAVYVTPPVQTRSLTVTSTNPNSGVSITVSPNDNGSLGSGTTTFTRTYNNNTVVNLTAPATAGGNNFQKWQRNSVDWSSSQSTSVTMDASYTMTAVYVTPPVQTRSLTVTSANPNSGVSITVSPNDNGSLGSGTTTFTRTYNNNTVVNLTAPATAGGNNFQKWQRNSVDWSSSQSTSVTMDASYTMTAVYVTPPVQTRSLTVTSTNPNSGVSITVSPNDNGSLGSGTTTFTRTYNNNTVVNLTAPATAGGNNFQKWQRDNVDWSSSQSTSVTMDANHTMTAIYGTTNITLTANPASVSPGGNINVTWTAPASHSTTDWIGLYQIAAGNSTWLSFKYVPAGSTGSLPFTAPTTPGTYEFRYLPNNGFVSVAASNSVTVTGGANDFSISAAPASQSITPGGSTSFSIGTQTISGNVQTVMLSVNGLPAGATPSFNPQSVLSGNSSSLTITTTTAVAPGTYPLSISGNNSAIIHSVPVTLVVGGYSLTASPTSVSSGGTIFLNWSAPSNHSTTDWIGLFLVGASNNTWVDYKYVPGGGSGSLTFIAPATAGSYEFRYLPNNGFTSTARSNTFIVGGVVNDFSIAANPGSQSISPGGSTSFNITTQIISGNAAPISLSVSGLPAGATPSFTPQPVTSGNGSTLTINTTAATPVGTYPLTITGINSLFTHSTNVSLVVGTGSGYSLQAAVSGGNVSATWTAPGNHSPTDWIGLFKTGSPNTVWVDFRYVPAGASGVLLFTTPTANDTYEFRYLQSNGFTSVATSNTFTIGGGGGAYSLTATPSAVQPGSQITVNWTAPSGHATTDWVGMYRPGMADSAFIAFQYLSSANSGTLSFVAPASEGGYEFRLYPNNGFTKAATSNPVAVSSTITLSPSATNVGPGASVTVSWNSSTTRATNDWIGLYAQGAADANFLAFQYIGSAGTSGSRTFTMPTKNGVYEFRYFLTDTYARAATSNSVNLTGGTNATEIGSLLFEQNDCKYEVLCKALAAGSRRRLTL